MLNWLRKSVLEFLSKNEKTIVVEKQTVVHNHHHHHHYDQNGAHERPIRQAGTAFSEENVLGRMLEE